MQLLVCYLFIVGMVFSGSAGFGQVLGDNIIHDPSRIIKENGRYYVYLTGLGGADGIFFKYSDDRVTWNDPGGDAELNAILKNAPAWTQQEVPGNDGTFWAPSIIQHNNEYRLYYSVSSFGSQDSAIGLATNTTLDYTSIDYEWVDQGLVIDSEVGDSYNAIDPSVFVDNDSRMWMTFGSFWDGVHIQELNPATGKPFSASPSAIKLAENPADPPNAIEAPYIHYRDGYYYLFANWGNCCQGVNSTYEIRVGRSISPTGPFVARGPGFLPMSNGEGTLFLGTENAFIGPGHMSIFSENGVDYFGYHYYDGTQNGLPKYNIETLAWTADGWPIPASDIHGDFNNDGTIDAADYTVWRDSLGATGLTPYTSGDADGDGEVTASDYDLWVTNFGATAASSVSVPEPATMAMVLTALPMLVLCHRLTFYFMT